MFFSVSSGSSFAVYLCPIGRSLAFTAASLTFVYSAEFLQWHIGFTRISSKLTSMALLRLCRVFFPQPATPLCIYNPHELLVRLLFLALAANVLRPFGGSLSLLHSTLLLNPGPWISMHSTAPLLWNASTPTGGSLSLTFAFPSSKVEFLQWHIDLAKPIASATLLRAQEEAQAGTGLFVSAFVLSPIAGFLPLPSRPLLVSLAGGGFARCALSGLLGLFVGRRPLTTLFAARWAGTP